MPRSVAKHRAATSSALRTCSPPRDATADTPRHYSARSPHPAMPTPAKRSDAVTGSNPGTRIRARLNSLLARRLRKRGCERVCGRVAHACCGRGPSVPRRAIGSHAAPAFACIRAADLVVASRSDVSPADQRASQAQERIVQAGVAFPADAEPAEVVQPGERPLHHPAHPAESGAVLGTAPRDHWFDASAPQLATVLVVVMAAIGDHRVRTATS